MCEHVLPDKLTGSGACGTDKFHRLSIRVLPSARSACGTDKFHHPIIRVRPPQESGAETPRDILMKGERDVKQRKMIKNRQANKCPPDNQKMLMPFLAK